MTKSKSTGKPGVEIETTQFRATSDTATMERIKQIIQAYLNMAGKTGNPVVRASVGRPGTLNKIMADIVLWVFNSSARRKELERFYTDEWLDKLEPARIKLAIQLKWDVDAHDALAVIANENIGSGNRSETLRVIIAFAASRRYGLPLTR